MLSVRLPGAGRSDLAAGGAGASEADWRSADLAEGAVPEPDRLFWARLRLVLIKLRQMAIDSVVSFMQVVCSRVPNIGRFWESALGNIEPAGSWDCGILPSKDQSFNFSV